MKPKAEKPQYGWFVKRLVISFSIIGIFGLIILIFSFILQRYIGLILLITGIFLIILFLWSGIGMAIINLILNSQKESELNIPALNEINSPQILDIGCGTGRTAIRIAKSMKKGGHLFGIDIYDKFAISGNDLETINNNARIEKVDSKTTFRYGSATEIPFENEFFDLINVSSVLHEIHDLGGQKKALVEVYRVLKPDGYLYLGEWNRNCWQLFAYMGIFSLVFKSCKYWLNLLKDHQFKIVSIRDDNGYIIFEAKK